MEKNSDGTTGCTGRANIPYTVLRYDKLDSSKLLRVLSLIETITDFICRCLSIIDVSRYLIKRVPP